MIHRNQEQHHQEQQHSGENNLVNNQHVHSQSGSTNSPQIFNMSSIVNYRPGSRVIVAQTPDIAAKLPKLAGCTGTVIEVPVHPNTWYTLKMDFTNALIKLRKSSFGPWNQQCHGKPIHVSSSLTDDVHTTSLNINSTSPVSVVSSSPSTPQTLGASILKIELPPQMPLRETFNIGSLVIVISSEKYLGQTGTIVSGPFNNGFWSVEMTSNHPSVKGKILVKRYCELRLAKKTDNCIPIQSLKSSQPLGPKNASSDSVTTTSGDGDNCIEYSQNSSSSTEILMEEGSTLTSFLHMIPIYSKDIPKGVNSTSVIKRSRKPVVSVLSKESKRICTRMIH